MSRDQDIAGPDLSQAQELFEDKDMRALREACEVSTALSVIIQTLKQKGLLTEQDVLRMEKRIKEATGYLTGLMCGSAMLATGEEDDLLEDAERAYAARLFIEGGEWLQEQGLIMLSATENIDEGLEEMREYLKSLEKTT
jgi:hypothetical protein